MASRAAIVHRASEVNKRLRKVLDAIADKSGVPIPEDFDAPLRKTMDPDLKRVMELERITAYLESVIGLEAPEVEEDEGDIETQTEDSKSEPMTRASLRRKNKAELLAILDQHPDAKAKLQENPTIAEIIDALVGPE